MNAQQQLITNFTSKDYNDLYTLLGKRGRAFLSGYRVEDLRNSIIIGQSGSTWEITPPNIVRLAEDLRSNQTESKLYFSVSFIRYPSSSLLSEMCVFFVMFTSS